MPRMLVGKCQVCHKMFVTTEGSSRVRCVSCARNPSESRPSEAPAPVPIGTLKKSMEPPRYPRFTGKPMKLATQSNGISPSNIPGGESVVPTNVLLMLLQAVGGSLVVTESDLHNPPDFDIFGEWSHSPQLGLRYEIELVPRRLEPDTPTGPSGY